MAVKFTQSFATLFTYSISRMFDSSFSVTVYSGALASPTTIVNNWTTYNQSSALCLWHAPNGCSWQVLTNTILSNATIPAAVAPLRSGTASWFIAWPTAVNINSVSIPTTRFMVGDVTNLFGTGIMKFVDTSLVTSTSTTFSEMSLKINFTG